MTFDDIVKPFALFFLVLISAGYLYIVFAYARDGWDNWKNR